MKPKIKPRNPFVALAKFGKAGTHTKPAKSLRRHEKQVLAKAAKQSPESCHNRIAHQCGYDMALDAATILGADGCRRYEHNRKPRIGWNEYATRSIRVGNG